MTRMACCWRASTVHTLATALARWMAECRLDTHVGHTGRALPMLATAMLRDSELGYAGARLATTCWTWATVHTMGRLMGILAGLHLCEFASRDVECGIPTCPFRLEFSSRMGYRPGHALYRYALEPTAGVCQLTFRHIICNTHVGYSGMDLA